MTTVSDDANRKMTDEMIRKMGRISDWKYLAPGMNYTVYTRQTPRQLIRKDQIIHRLQNGMPSLLKVIRINKKSLSVKLCGALGNITNPEIIKLPYSTPEQLAHKVGNTDWYLVVEEINHH
jgi:hypothetical protein